MLERERGIDQLRALIRIILTTVADSRILVTSPTPLGGFESPAEVLLFLPALSPPAALGVTI